MFLGDDGLVVVGNSRATVGDRKKNAPPNWAAQIMEEVFDD